MRKLDKALGQKSLRISVGYLEDMWGIAGRYLGDILGYIGDTYLGDIARGVSGGFLGDIWGISLGYHGDISIFDSLIFKEEEHICWSSAIARLHCLFWLQIVDCTLSKVRWCTTNGPNKRYKEPMSFGSNSNCFSALKVKKQKGGDST